MICNKKGLTPIPGGNTYALSFQFMDGDNPVVLPQDYDLIVGIYDLYENLLKKGSYLEGSITLLPNNIYKLSVTHEESKKMEGQVIMEVTVANASRTVVAHSKDTVTIKVEYRRNNKLL